MHVRIKAAIRLRFKKAEAAFSMMDYHGSGNINKETMVTFFLGLAQPYGREDYEEYMARMNIMGPGDTLETKRFEELYFSA